MNSLSFSIILIADSVQRVSLPGTQPGASNSVLRDLMLTISMPGILFAAFNALHLSDTTINGPFLFPNYGVGLRPAV